MKNLANELKIFYTNNRKKLSALLRPNSIAIINSNDVMPRTGDQFYKFRQNSDLFYLCGINQEETTLILCPNHPNKALREVLFIKPVTEHATIWEGHKLTKYEATQISGIESIKFNDELNSTLRMMMNVSDNVYLNTNETPSFITELPYNDLRFAQKIKTQYPIHTYLRLAPLITSLRLIKQVVELKIISHAIQITQDAFLDVLKHTKPNIPEYEIEARITYNFIKNQCTHAYPPIIASGKNALCLHYNTNNDICQNGNLILLDFGAEYNNYASDLSRTIPVNGKFTKRQKQIYNAVLKVMNTAKKLLIPNTTIAKINIETGKLMEAELINLGLLKKSDIKNQDPNNPLYKKYYMHGLSHFIGLDVHDTGNRDIVLKNNMVVSCEPGIYIPEEQIGIRLENDIVINNNSPIDLMAKTPIKADEIEALMNK